MLEGNLGKRDGASDMRSEIKLTWERRDIAGGFPQIVVFEHGEGYTDELGAIFTKGNGHVFVFNSPWKSIMYGVGGMVCAGFSGVKPGSQQFSFPSECATTDQEVAEFTIKLLGAGKRKFDAAPNPSK